MNWLPIRKPNSSPSPEARALIDRIEALFEEGRGEEAMRLFESTTSEHTGALREAGLKKLSILDSGPAHDYFLRMHTLGGESALDSIFLVAISQSLRGYAHFAKDFVEGCFWEGRFLTPRQMAVHNLAVVRWELDLDRADRAPTILESTPVTPVALLYRAEALRLNGHDQQALNLLGLGIDWGELESLRDRMSTLLRESPIDYQLVSRARAEQSIDWPEKLPLWMHPLAMPGVECED